MSRFSWGTDAHHAWLEDYRNQLLDFYQSAVVDPAGGYFWLDTAGRPKPAEPKGLWIAARMVHCFSLAALLGRPGAQEVAEHGVAHLLSDGRDQRHGGWFAAVGADADSRKELYGLAHVILAGSSARQAGIDGGEDLLDEALELVERHFWLPGDAAGIDCFDEAFAVADPYRGLNANMHLTEAFLAAHEATGQRLLLDRALQLAQRFARDQLLGEPGHRLVEHFDEDWRPQPEYNRDDPAHPFRPYGSTPGHWLEWAKLCCQIRGLRPEVDWLVPAARQLFDGALADAWADNGGFYYTVDFAGRPVISARFFWPVTEAIGAAHMLSLATGEQRYTEWYERFWLFAWKHLMDHEQGSWHSELDDELRPTVRTWDGKPDLYHVLQATLYAQLPLDVGLAAQLAR
ncbi:AGE family epimerase/isomerase [Tessaracoccus sp. OH4464_COT-324]|uniref:AGE family epimerase/isomerase n=1 Tax=Tessaracoccus sp. OH4464_COT-324 TaxID=2491059 RepID=UPI000F63DAD1|nr:AGE family epimerase/isomerase [Tessaracoccus sp. OH4464_COT-324]RRD45769.1 AGE family epimerase/isomerase [Tessaracoccus sp. OH4464_COT-324]